MDVIIYPLGSNIISVDKKKTMDETRTYLGCSPEHRSDDNVQIWLFRWYHVIQRV